MSRYRRARAGAARHLNILVQHMRLIITIGAVSAVMVASTVATASHIPGQRIVAERTIHLLPAPLQEFYEPHLDAVVEHAIEPDGAWRRNRAYVNRDDWHYLMLDVDAEDASTQARVAAAEAFPRSRTDARNLAAERGIERIGELPWQLKRIARGLAKAFRYGDRDEILILSGEVIHFCADAAFPLRCTRDAAGAPDRNSVFASAGMGDDMFAHQDLSHRIGWELVRRNAHRYQLTLSRGPADRVVVRDVRETCFDTMTKALADVDALLSTDAELCDRMNIRDAASFSARMDEYYQLLDEMCGRQCVDSLRRGSALAAGVITYAWEKSDSSDMPVSQDSDATELAGISPPPTEQDPPPPVTSSNHDAVADSGFVASANSKVFHRPDCPHVKRINDKNLRHFATAQDALDSGRRPCRSCEPDSSD